VTDGRLWYRYIMPFPTCSPRLLSALRRAVKDHSWCCSTPRLAVVSCMQEGGRSHSAGTMAAWARWLVWSAWSSLCLRIARPLPPAPALTTSTATFAITTRIPPRCSPLLPCGAAALSDCVTAFDERVAPAPFPPQLVVPCALSQHEAGTPASCPLHA
jgi:hypothetical protein